MPRPRRSVLFFTVLCACAALTGVLSFYKIAIGNAYRTFPTYDVPLPPALGFEGEKALAQAQRRGARLCAIVGCPQCHGEQGEGRLLSDGRDGVVLAAPALFGPQKRLATMDDAALWRTLRVGLDGERRALWAMPRQALLSLVDEDVVALMAHLRAQQAAPQPVSSPFVLPHSHLRFWGYAKIAARRLWLVERRAPKPGPWPWDSPSPLAQRPPDGRYLTAIGRCQSCHRPSQGPPTTTIAALPPAPPFSQITSAARLGAEPFAAAWQRSGCRTPAPGWQSGATVPRAALFEPAEQQAMRQAWRVAEKPTAR